MKRPAVTITVMPDYGGGSYAWEKPESDSTSYVGICVATAMHGFETEGGTKISSDLETAFNDWTGDFERGADKPEFDWRVFHATGMRLSRRLQSELGDRFRVVYLKPFEDPDREINEYTEVGRCS